MFSKAYLDEKPPALSFEILSGGRGATQLSGGDVTYDQVYPDIESLLD